MTDDKLGRIVSYDEEGAPIREDYCTHCGAGRTRGDHAAECPRAYRQAVSKIACTCKCSPEEHGPNGCKTWYGDRNTGFRCNCDWRLLKYPKVREIAERMAAQEKPLRSTHQDRLALDCGRLIIEKLKDRLRLADCTIVDLPVWVEEEIRQEIAQIILKNGFEKL